MTAPHRLLVLLVALAVASGCDNPAKEAQQARVGEAEAGEAQTVEPTGAAAQAVELPIALDASKVEFVGSKVTGSHEGGFKVFSGTVRVADGAVVGADVEIDMDSTWSDNEKLTGHLKSADFFDVEKFPTSRFATTRIEAGADAAEMPEATHTVTGNLTLHGVTKSIQFAAKIAVEDGKASVESAFAINRKDFGIVYAGRADDLIRDEVLIRLSVEASGA